VSALAPSRRAALAASGRRLMPLAWPVFVGQISVLAFSTVDTVMVARYAALDLAALAIGAAAYITIFIGLMGVVLAISPIVGQLFGAGKLEAAGRHVHQTLWIALGMALLGCGLLAFPDPFLAVANAEPEVEARVRGYLLALAFALPAGLLFAIYRGFNIAVSRPKAVMVLQISGLALKVPLSWLLVFGHEGLGIPALGVVGCGIATALAMWAQVLAATVILLRDPFYHRFALNRGGLARPQRAAIVEHLRLGVPMGAAILIEVAGFGFMALFIARLGAEPVAGHQLAMNMVTLLFMMPLALGHATSTLVAQRIGAGDLRDARRLAWHGVEIALALALGLGAVIFFAREGVVGLYTRDAAVVAAALPLLAWVALFHAADAVQIVAAFALRAFKIATVPVLIYAGALWGVGLGGGWVLAFDSFGLAPAALQGAPGFWFAATIGLTLAAIALSLYLRHVLRRQAAALMPSTPTASPPAG
jgi:multidrug resistance protein, MATE family